MSFILYAFSPASKPGVGQAPSTNFYTAEDGATLYVAEDGVTNYVQEN